MKRTRTLIFTLALLMAVGAGLLATADAGQTVRTQKAALIPTDFVSLTDSEEQEMVFIREEEKLARDVYITMSGIYKDPIFATIAVSEQRHMDAVLKLLNRYGVADPAAGKAIGEFTDPDIQALYDSLVARGGLSVVDAYEVGVIIEETEIHDLEVAVETTVEAGLSEAHADIVKVYTKLREGSFSHLDAFNEHLLEQ